MCPVRESDRLGSYESIPKVKQRPLLKRVRIFFTKSEPILCIFKNIQLFKVIYFYFKPILLCYQKHHTIKTEI